MEQTKGGDGTQEIFIPQASCFKKGNESGIKSESKTTGILCAPESAIEGEKTEFFNGQVLAQLFSTLTHPPSSKLPS
jgi:hypothetical protein